MNNMIATADGVQDDVINAKGTQIQDRKEMMSKANLAQAA